MVKKVRQYKRGAHLDEPLAIVGMGCHFPGVQSDLEETDAFYRMLIQAETAVKEIPLDRWDINRYYDPDRKKADKMITRKGGFLDDITLFDAPFFKIPAVEAKQMDPQQRLFLQTSVRAINHANIRLDSLKDSNTGVYCGISTYEYSQLNYKDHIAFNAYTPIGIANSAAAGRLSHFLHLKGPSMVVDTACSSSFSALYLGAMALRARECDLAIVGGIHLNLCPENFIGLSKASTLSPSGQSSSFDENADGYARSEGCAVVLVKRLSDAIHHQDKIYGIIKSIVMNQDGDGISMVAPNKDAQRRMHAEVLARADLTAGDIAYIETHGTGTPVGDAVEFNALELIHRDQHTQESPLIVGALKSILGHTISASGLAALIKVMCSFQQEYIPPNLHYSAPNSLIDPECIPALFPLSPIAFPSSPHKKRYAQVSNFGFTGTNVAAVIEEPPSGLFATGAVPEKGLYCFVVSAHSASSLRQMLTDYQSYLQHSVASLGDICYSQITCRDHYKYRCALLAVDKKSLIEMLAAEDFEIKKITPDKELTYISFAPEKIYDAYLSGANLQLIVDEGEYSKVDLPLYRFDKKSYWHEVRQPEYFIAQPCLSNPEPVAIIGMSCRFPRAANIEALLSLLESGEQGMVDIPLSRWDNERYYDANVDALGRLYIRQLGFMDHIRDFDADFFNISPREAKYMSPQVRVFMETSYHAIENANLSLERIKGSDTGVFVGFGTNEYQRYLAYQGVSLEQLNIYYATGNVANALPGRIAYAFDLHGPTQAIDTACSSSMTAIHNACMSIHAGDCTMAIAGGINTLLLPDSNIALSRAKMLSPDSRCKTFSDDADGYARSEGCGVLVLKRLSAAVRDKDNILAVIKGSAVNSDGKSSGFTVPNAVAQEEVIRCALAKAQLSPADIDYIEAHGTGTPLADPIEANTITKIFADYHSEERPLYLGSIKTNIGHTESASGVAGIIKAVLSLRTDKLFQHLHFKQLNPKINLRNTIIPLTTLKWPKRLGLRSIGVSSFGFSGTNAHVIIQEALAPVIAARDFPSESLLVLSAKNKAALELLLSSYQDYLSTTADSFADLCYTAATCRSHFLCRVAIRAPSALEAARIIATHKYTIHQIKKEKAFTPTNGTLDELSLAYQQGYAVNWLAFYHSLKQSFIKVNLPLYEFTREEHWFDDKDKLQDAVLPVDWCFETDWQQQDLAVSGGASSDAPWLLIGARHLAGEFNARGLRLVFLDDEYPLSKLQGIIFAVALDSTIPESIDAAVELQKKNIKQLLTLVKTLHQETPALRLIVLARNSIAELLSGAANLINSPLLGWCKTMALELPQYHTVFIDSDEWHAAAVVAQTLNEINDNFPYEHLVAYRGGRRLVPRLKKMRLPDKAASLLGNARYLITGGCGGLGWVSAQALLSAGAKELILVSRHIDTPEIRAEIKKIRSAYPGRVITLVSQDVTDKESLKQLLLDLGADGCLKGIIHAAGVGIKSALLDHRLDEVDQVFAAKVQGAWYLHELTQHLELDFFVLYSSISSVFGSNKEAVYSAANSFLDVLIAERRRLGLVGTAIQWGPWGESGMAKQRSRDQGLKLALLSNEQGQAFIKRLIGDQSDHIAVISPAYLQFMLDFVPKPLPAFHYYLNEDLNFSSPTQKLNDSSWLLEYAELDAADQEQACYQMILATCKEILELSPTDELEADEGFFDIGFDSLMIAELANKLKASLEPSVKVAVNIGFDHPTINALSQYIKAALDEQQQQNQPLAGMGQQHAIAIVGMSCSFPGAPDITAFERLLFQGLSGIREIPGDRWDNSHYYDPDIDAPRKSYVYQLGLIEHIACFDAPFFGISPREAKLIDPQQRIFLENCYTAFEDANYPMERLRGSLTGVFAGVAHNEYHSQLEKSSLYNDQLSAYALTGNAPNLIPGRVAYVFDLKGPAVSFDTACSSSLVALHYACQSLINQEIDYALAGGVNVLLRPESNITLCKARALSPEGQCKTFDARADGYVRAEGCGVVLLKRVADAWRDKDRIIAVIKGSAINNDGKSAGLTVPSGKSQEAVMRLALEQAALSASDITYIEAHGTGTPLGDPIEVHAINQVYGRSRPNDNPLYIGAVKTNIGHLESAAGIASLIKVVIGLQQKKIYKNLNFHQLNPKIDLGYTQIALQYTDWLSQSTLRCAGVNAFGFSGTNAHVIVQEYPCVLTQQHVFEAKPHLLLLSAKSPSALTRLVTIYQDYLATTRDDFADICYTSAIGRSHYRYRTAIIAGDAAEAATKLATSWDRSINSALWPSLFEQLTAYMQGKAIDWVLFYQHAGREFHKVRLPHYSFDLIEYWFDKSVRHAVVTEQGHPLIGRIISMPNNQYLFSKPLDLEQIAYIQQHRVFDQVVFPGTAFIECGLAAAKALLKRDGFSLESFSIEQPLFPRQDQELQVQVKPMPDQRYKIKVFAQQADEWQLFSEMALNPLCLPESVSVDINELKRTFGYPVDLSELYKNLKQKALLYGHDYQVIQESYAKTDSVLSKVALPQTRDSYYYHPVVLDVAMHSIVLLGAADDGITYIPYAFSRMLAYQASSRSMWVHLVRHFCPRNNELWVEIKYYDNSGLLLGHIEELKLRKVTPHHFIAYQHHLKDLYHTQWSVCQPGLLEQETLPEFCVIGQDVNKIQNLLAGVKYQVLENFNQLVSCRHKNIMVFYDQQRFNELFHFCQRLFKEQPNCFILITENAYAIHLQDTVNPYHTMASAFWKTLSNELEFRNNYTIDVGGQGNLAKALLYLLDSSCRENQLAQRDSLYIPRLRKAQLSPELSVEQITFNPDASYLITGGTGALAKLLIDYLISRGARYLVLTGRCHLGDGASDFSEWTQQQGIAIQYHQIDASDYQGMKQLILAVNQGEHPLKGVFHLAGKVQSGLIVHLDDAELEPVLSAKRDGALILHQLTKDSTLDYFVLFSSIASVLGASGQSNYVAANGFLDGLAHLRRQQGLPALAINWGPFNSLGMTTHFTPALQQHGFRLLDKESLNILDLLLKGPFAQIALCPVDWDIYFKYAPKPAWLVDPARNRDAGKSHFLNQLRQQNEEQALGTMMQVLADIVAEVLGLEPHFTIDYREGLFALGLDSLMALEIRNKIHDWLNCPRLHLSIEYFINEPTIHKIAQYVLGELHLIFTEPSDFPVLAQSEEYVALCDFQYVFWVLNRLNYSFNLGSQLRLEGRLNTEYLVKAFEAVVQQHGAFWLSFNKEQPMQKVKRAGQLNFLYEDITLNHEELSLDAVFRHNIARIVPLDQQPLIRIHLYKISENLHELHLIIPHIIIDDQSSHILLSQFKKNYAALARGEELVSVPEQSTYFDFVSNNNILYQRQLEHKIDFWRAYNKDFYMLRFRKKYHLINKMDQPAHLFHFPLDTPLLERFIAWHQEKNLNVSSGLVVLCQVILYLHSDQKNIPITLLHSGREGSQYKASIGLFSEYTRLNLSLNEKHTLADAIRAIEEQLLKTAPYQKCSHLIKNSGFKGSGLSFTQYAMWIFNRYWLKPSFQKSKLPARIIDYYLRYLSQIELVARSKAIKNRFNQLLGLDFSRQEQDRMRVLISITPSFFSKKMQDLHFADMRYHFASHIACMDRPISNQTLWIYFSKNQDGEPLFSINGPLNTDGKNRMAKQLNSMISCFLENEEHTLDDWILAMSDWEN